MKKTTLILLFSFFISVNFAQDTIIKFNNDKVIAKIIEINPGEVKYKKFNFQDGPTYIDNKSEIKMIVYANGMKETFGQEQTKTSNTDYYSNPNISNNKIDDQIMYYGYHNTRINQPQMQNILLQTKDKKIVDFVLKAKEARKVEFISFAAIPLGIAAYGLFIASALNTGVNSNTNSGLNSGFVAGGVVCLAATISCPIISSVNRHKKVKYNSEAIRLYNQKF